MAYKIKSKVEIKELIEEINKDRYLMKKENEHPSFYTYNHPVSSTNSVFNCLLERMDKNIDKLVDIIDNLEEVE